MDEVRIHVRYTTSDFDGGEGPGSLFDSDASEGALNATESVLAFFKYLVEEKKFKGKYAALSDNLRLSRVEPAMSMISRNFWKDFDYDDRMKLAQVREELQKIVKGLSNVTALLGERPPYVRLALNSEDRRLALPHFPRSSDVYQTALDSNQALLLACESLIKRDRENPGEAIRFRNACFGLSQLWEEMLEQRFPKTTKYSDGKIEPMTGVEAAFDNPAAQFVYIAVFRIGRGWVKPSQIEAAIKALPKRRKQSDPEG